MPPLYAQLPVWSYHKVETHNYQYSPLPGYVNTPPAPVLVPPPEPFAPPEEPVPEEPASEEKNDEAQEGEAAGSEETPPDDAGAYSILTCTAKHSYSSFL